MNLKRYLSRGDENRWYFSADLRFLFPRFDSVDSNHDLCEYLRSAGVISAEDTEDTEFCQTFIYFRDEDSALAFIERIEAFLIFCRENDPLTMLAEAFAGSRACT